MDGETNFQMQGKLKKGDIFSLLYHIYKHDISGVLAVHAVQAGQTGGFEKKLVIRDRKIVFASSNQRIDSFGDFLLRRNLVSRDIFSKAAQYMAGHKKRFGRALMELGYFNYEQVWTLVPNHLKSIVFSFFQIESGDYRITEGVREHMDGENIVLDLDILTVIVEGIRQFRSGDFFAGKFTAIEHLFVNHANTDLMDSLALKPYESHVFHLVEQDSRLEAITARSELLKSDTLRLLYLFLVLEIISTRESAAPPAQIKKAGTLPGPAIPGETPSDSPAAVSRPGAFHSFEEALRYYNMKYEVIYKVMLKEIGPISISLLLRTIGDIKDNLPPYFRNVQLNPDGTVNEEMLLKALWYHNFDDHIGDFLRALEEVLYAEIYTVKKHLGLEYEQQVIKWIRGTGD